MFSARSQPPQQDEEPLLSSNTIFAVDDDSDDELDPSADTPGRVRFKDNVQVIEPEADHHQGTYVQPLRSTISSRENQYELDSDELDDSHTLDDTTPTRRAPGYMDQSMPLLVGLYDASSARRSLDSPSYPLSENGRIDLEELANKSKAGGGLLDSIANMANSILGAGKFLRISRVRFPLNLYSLQES